MGMTMGTDNLEVVEKPTELKPLRLVPKYGRVEVDKIIAIIQQVAGQVVEHNISQVQINLSADDALILNDMLYEMDKHLPDFFEEG